jgi:hypothetical protein
MTDYGTATVSTEQNTVHPSVAVPGVGTVDVNIERPDWL